MAETLTPPQPERDDTVYIGKGVGFDRVRRITGYLVGSLDRFNNAKRAEEADRVKHDAGEGNAGRKQKYASWSVPQD